MAILQNIWKIQNFFWDKCPVGQMSCWTNVLVGQMSGLDKCLVRQMSDWTNFWLEKCQVGQISGWTNVWLDNCLVGQMSVGQTSVGQSPLKATKNEYFQQKHRQLHSFTRVLLPINNQSNIDFLLGLYLHL